MDFVISNDKNFELNSKVFNKITFKKLNIFLKKRNYKKFKDKYNIYYIFGNINGLYDKKFNLSKINNSKLIKTLNNNKQFLLDGKFLILRLNENYLQLSTDYFNRYEVYYNNTKEILISSSLEIFKYKKSIKKKLDKLSIAHSLSVYGNRPFKEDTIYFDISRVAPNQNIYLKSKKLQIKKFNFRPLRTNPKFGEDQFKEYTSAFLNTLKAKKHGRLNIIYLSSGWDSTSILAGLVRITNKKNIKCVIGRMKYSKNKIANTFEISRAKKICDFYGVKLEITDFDYYKDSKIYNSDLYSFLNNNQLASITSINHFYLAKFVKQKFGDDCYVFCGEISDGSHNLGFSQYVSIYHPASYDFREYSDKMNSYLFGPTFLNFVYKNQNLTLDPIFSYFKNLNNNIEFEKLSKKKKEINSQFISSFFLRATRLPFVSKNNLNFLTNKGKNYYQNKMINKKIIKKFITELKPDNLYSVFLYLYNYFHWQGSTVLSFEKTCQYFGLVGHLPFLDRKIINILSIMPEKYGRGLDLNNTKYPLKKMLREKVKYPYNLQEGPHSYLYDVDRNFNHNYELLYNSAFKNILKKKISKKNFINKLDKNYFNLHYINKLRTEYLNNSKLSGQDLNNLFALAFHELVYSEIPTD